MGRPLLADYNGLGRGLRLGASLDGGWGFGVGVAGFCVVIARGRPGRAAGIVTTLVTIAGGGGGGALADVSELPGLRFDHSALVLEVLEELSGSVDVLLPLDHLLDLLQELVDGELFELFGLPLY